jgi:hypothetical protein
MYTNKIGQNFTKKYNLDLLPGIKLPIGTYKTHIEYITDIGNSISMFYISRNVYRDIHTCTIGCDVREISLEIEELSNPAINYHYYLRVDRLILLNLAFKLTKK